MLNPTLNIETVIAQVLIEECTCALAQMALTITTPKGVSNAKHKSQKKNKMTEKCHYCKRVGHYEYECRKKKRDEMAKEKNEKSENLKGFNSSCEGDFIISPSTHSYLHSYWKGTWWNSNYAEYTA